jgi:hypothetical protein
MWPHPCVPPRAPECFNSNSVDEKVDIYAMGIIMWWVGECLVWVLW